MPKFADDAAADAAKKQLETEKQATEKSRTEYADRMKGRPTPTQEELNLSKLGVHIVEHDHDGSDPDPHDPSSKTKHLEGAQSGGKPQSYATRQSTAKPTAE